MMNLLELILASLLFVSQVFSAPIEDKSYSEEAKTTEPATIRPRLSQARTLQSCERWFNNLQARMFQAQLALQPPEPKK